MYVVFQEEKPSSVFLTLIDGKKLTVYNLM